MRRICALGPIVLTPSPTALMGSTRCFAAFLEFFLEVYTSARNHGMSFSVVKQCSDLRRD